MEYWRVKFAEQQELKRQAAIRLAEASDARAKSSGPACEVSNQLLQLRIQTAYPNNPAMWRWLNSNPRYIPTYLGE